jgi:hypothetical protein
MLIPPLALAVGAVGLLLRGHRRAVMIVAIAVAFALGGQERARSAW